MALGLSPSTPMGDHEAPETRGNRRPSRRPATGPFAVLAEASARLSATAAPADTLRDVARLIVPAVGDLCLIHLVEEGDVRLLAAVHGTPARQAALDALLPRYPHRLDGPEPAPTAMRTGQAVLIPTLTDARVARCVRGAEEVQLVRDLGIRSLIAVPLTAHGRTLGAITLGITEAGRRYTARDLCLAQALAGMAATALDNARLRERLGDADDERERQQALLDTLFAHCPLGVALVDRDLRVVRVSTAVTRMNGVSAGAFAGRAFADAFPRLAAQVEPILRHVLATGDPVVNLDITVEGPGSTAARHRRASYYPVRDRGGAVSGVCVMVTSVTESLKEAVERERLVAELATERELLQAVIDQMPAGVAIVLAGPGHVVQCNARLAEMWPQVVSDHAWIQRVLRDGEAAEGEEVVVDARGHGHGVLRVSSANVRDARGQIVAGVLTAYDITEHKRAATAAEETHARMRALMEASPLPTVAKDAQGNVTAWNRAAERTFGWAAHEVLGRPLPTVPEDKREEYASFFERVSRGESLHGLIVRRRRRDGTLLPMMLSVSPVYDENGTYVGNIAMYADMTERTRFLQTAAHELRNPIAGVKSVASLLRRRITAGSPTAELVRMAELMEHEVDRLAKLSDDMLEVFRIQEGRLPLRPRRIDLRAVVASALRPFIEADHDRRFTLDQPASPVWIWGDFDRLEEVVRNLLSNAIKYSPGGGEVRVRLEADQTRVRLSVSDSGVGIPADQLNRVFEAFFRGNNLSAHDPGGMGLGLYICSELVQRHGGTIRAESREGSGATFHVELPPYAEQEEA